MNSKNIVLIGGGNMATALVSGFLASGYHAEHIFVVEHHPDKCAMLAARFNIQTAPHLTAFLDKADILILAIKPKDAKAFALEMSGAVQAKAPLIISIMAGINLSTLADWFGPHIAMVRAMPNIPALVKTGATGLVANAFALVEHKSEAEHLFRSIGIVAWLARESDLNTITALAGSSPAYFFYLLEAMAQQAVKMGINPSDATLFAIQSCLGAAKLALESGVPLAQLREQVTSKGGTTEAALAVFDQMKLSDIIAEAMKAAMCRAEEIGELFKE